MKLVMFLIVLSLAGCCSVPPLPKQKVPVMVDVEYESGHRTEYWRRPDGSFYIRFKRPYTGDWYELDIHHN